MLSHAAKMLDPEPLTKGARNATVKGYRVPRRPNPGPTEGLTPTEYSCLRLSRPLSSSPPTAPSSTLTVSSA